MARSQKDRRPKPEKAEWVRSGGFIGDKSMEDLQRFAEDGCGVSEQVKDVGSDPNLDVEHETDRSHLG